MRGRFIAFEGIDGSGKSSTLERAVQALRQEGHDVVATREETATPRGGWIRQSIAEGWDPVATACLFAADRAQHVREIQAWLDAGKTVLCDRFLHSSLAYQSVALQGRVPDPRAFVAGLHAGWCPLPDKVLLFRADPAKCVARVAKRGATAAYEKAQFLELVQAAYLREAQLDAKRFHVLDAERDIRDVGRDAVAILRGWLA